MINDIPRMFDLFEVKKASGSTKLKTAFLSFAMGSQLGTPPINPKTGGIMNATELHGLIVRIRNYLVSIMRDDTSGS